VVRVPLPHSTAHHERQGRHDLAAAGGLARGDDVLDAHLAALMRQHEVRVIYTREKGFRRFDGIEVRDPLAAG
jgi:predicted nucleic acid-binding protein